MYFFNILQPLDPPQTLYKPIWTETPLLSCSDDPGFMFEGETIYILGYSDIFYTYLTNYISKIMSCTHPHTQNEAGFF